MSNVSPNLSDEFIRILDVLKNCKRNSAKMHKTMMKVLYESIVNDVHDILEEDDMESKLNKAITAFEDSERPNELPPDYKAWRPPGDVKLHMRTLDVTVMKEESAKLEEQITNMENENSSLMQRLIDKRSQIDTLNKKITRIINLFPSAVLEMRNTEKELQHYNSQLK
ncbi:uncharacterized protein [Prorops nasuta]|uniref:uncharacterized protein isoform X2 n=1 Tax=Prorops nasuta TaxID=863751 RepID=UPI0034CF8877